MAKAGSPPGIKVLYRLLIAGKNPLLQEEQLASKVLTGINRV